MSKEQTAVEWLEEQMKTWGYLSAQMKVDIIQEAKEREKLQIVEAHGSKLKKSKGTSNYEYWLTGIQYYNEKFNNLKCIENE